MQGLLKAGYWQSTMVYKTSYHLFLACEQVNVFGSSLKVPFLGTGAYYTIHSDVW